MAIVIDANAVLTVTNGFSVIAGKLNGKTVYVARSECGNFYGWTREEAAANAEAFESARDHAGAP